VNISKKKTIIFISIALIVSSPYVYFKSLNEYTFEPVANIASKDGIVYHMNAELTKGELKRTKSIGKIKGEGFFNTLFYGPRIYKLKEYDEKEAIALVYYFDDDYVYVKVKE
jgi:hypothetical protein